MLAELGEDAGCWRAGRVSCRCSTCASRGRRRSWTSGASRSCPGSPRTARCGSAPRRARRMRCARGRSPSARRCWREALRHVGHPATRSRGTVGGSIAHADPAAELPAVLLALDGEATVVSAGGERIIPAASLFLGPFATALAEGELLTACALPPRPAGAPLRLRRDRAAPGRLRARRRRRRRRTGPRARRALRRRSVRLPGRRGGARAGAGRRGRGGSALAAAAADPSGDPHATAAYRREAARVATLRALLEAGVDAWLTSAPCSLRVNGRPRLALAEPRTLLSDFLRHELGLTGTHVGCEHGACGACTVLVDGAAGALVPDARGAGRGRRGR